MSQPTKHKGVGQGVRHGLRKTRFYRTYGAATLYLDRHRHYESLDIQLLGSAAGSVVLTNSIFTIKKVG